MTPEKRALIRDLYEHIKSGKTTLGFNDEKGVGVISIVDYRSKSTQLMPVAEISGDLILPEAVTE